MARLNGRVQALERRIEESRPCPGPHGPIIYGPGQPFERLDDVPPCGCPEGRVRIFLPERRSEE